MSTLGSGVLGAGTLAGGEPEESVGQSTVLDIATDGLLSGSTLGIAVRGYLGGQGQTGVQFGTSAFTGTATYDSSAYVQTFAVASLSGVGTFDTDGVRNTFGDAGFTSDADWTVDGTRFTFGDSAFSGDATWTADGTRVALGDADFSGDATWTATGDRTAYSTADLSGTAIYDASGVRVAFGGADFLGNADFVGTVREYDPFAEASMIGNAFIQAFVPPDFSGTGYKNLWTPLREAVTEPVSLKAETRIRFKIPQTPVPLSIGVETDPIRVTHLTKVKGIKPLPSVVPPEVSVRTPSKVKARKPRGVVNTGFVRLPNEVRVNWLPPIPEVVVMPVPIKRKTYYAYWKPEAVQNPTEEMLMML